MRRSYSLSAQKSTKDVVRKGQEKSMSDHYNSLDATNKEEKDPVIWQSSEFVISFVRWLAKKKKKNLNIESCKTWCWEAKMAHCSAYSRQRALPVLNHSPWPLWMLNSHFPWCICSVNSVILCSKYCAVISEVCSMEEHNQQIPHFP